MPAYNEEKNVGRVVRGLFENGFDNVLVVDDGSKDKTVEQAESAKAKVIHHVVNRGQGAALRTGNEYVLQNNAEFIVHFDADGQFNPQDIFPAINLLKEKDLDIIFGSRFLDQRSQIPFFKKTIVLPISRLVNYFLTGLKLTDAHNGFRVMKAEACRKILISQDGMAHNSEITSQVKRKKLKFAECPVEVKYHEYGQGIGGGLKILRDLFFSKVVK